MKATRIIVVSIIASLATIGIALPASAAEPAAKTSIKKTVQNQTTNSEVADANDTATALSAKHGDILKYTITLTNEAGSDAGDDFILKSTAFTDNLPSGVELISNPSTRIVSETLGNVQPGKSVSKQFLVRVSADGNETVTNKACFTGKYAEDAQSGCDNAVIKLGTGSSVPAPTAPTPTPAAPTQGTVQADDDLPTTGPETLLAPLAAILAAGFIYATRMYVFTRFDR